MLRAGLLATSDSSSAAFLDPARDRGPLLAFGCRRPLLLLSGWAVATGRGFPLSTPARLLHLPPAALNAALDGGTVRAVGVSLRFSRTHSRIALLLRADSRRT